MAEGPLNRRSGATYIAQFRYNTLKLAHKVGLMENVPDFTDLSFKFQMPGRHMGMFSIFGMGGIPATYATSISIPMQKEMQEPYRLLLTGGTGYFRISP